MTDLKGKTLFITGASRGTGNFFVDDAILKAGGITDLSRYAVDPNVEQMPDFFV
ncbi:hypothetical protein D1BOALGB6SA_6367 [Olavius sp. associated proteobacterium Delta 1]|nr:hypothetical protein D1BOALGB6SA_6367 [Olavius sp. associated proteobacterium Delta 1]